MHPRLFLLVLCFAGLGIVGIRAAADQSTEAPAPKSFHIIFFGYQQLNGEMVFQIHVDELADADQPHLVKSGERLKFGPYQVGAFREVLPPVVNPGGNLGPNLSTLEIINVNTGAKILLPFRQKVKL
jgi:hypothetical protein